MAKVFITGGAGFIGSHTVDLCVEEGHEVTVFDIRSWEEATNLHPQKDKITYIEGDIRNRETLLEAMRGHTHVLHLAALVSVPESMEEPVRFHDTNVTGTLHVFEAARKSQVQRVVYASSAAVYGAKESMPISEEASLQPLSPYGLHKVINEEYATLYTEVYAQQFLGLRYFNVYGPRQDPHSPYSGVISIFTEKMKRNEPIIIYGDGSATRDFVSVFDVARANLLALMSRASGVCNIGTGNESSLKTLVTSIENVLEHKATIAYADERAGDIRRSLASVGDAARLIDFTANDTLEDGLRKTIHI